MRASKASRRLKVWQVSNGFGYAGTEGALALWARSLERRVFAVSAFARLSDGPRRQQLLKAGVRARVLGPDLQAWKAELERGAPDLMHVHRHGEEDADWSALAVLARSHGVRVLVETNVFGVLRRSEGPASPDVLATVSAFCLWRYARWPAKLSQDYLGPHAVFYNPLDLPRFPPKGFSAGERRAARRALDLPEDAIVAGRLGRPDPNKWPAWLLPALAAALRQDARLHLVFMEAPPALRAQAQRLGVASRCRFLPESGAEADVTRFYAALDVLAHASRVGESFGYTLAEAMAWGIPVLVDSTPWADNAQIELVEHEVEGLVAGRPAAFTAGLLRLASDPSLRQRLGRRARASASRFDGAALTRSLEGVYARALLAQGLKHPALAAMAARPTAPDASWIQDFNAVYGARLQRREQASAWADGCWALYSRVRLYGRGWLSRALKAPWRALRKSPRA
jgi:glycosyltransferase involved in cell wall biosynthesis